MTVVTKIQETEQVDRPGATGLCADASLRTPFGPRRVEFLREGDLIVTRDNGLQPIRLIWARTVTAAEIAADPSLAPIVLRPRAIGPMMPQRSLSVGAGHRLLIPGWRLLDVPDTESSLVPARDIAGLNDSSFIDRSPDVVTYYNVVFDEHQVVTANGLPVESFLPSPETVEMIDRKVRQRLKGKFPDLGPRFRDYPAPRYTLRERVSYNPDFA